MIIDGLENIIKTKLLLKSKMVGFLVAGLALSYVSCEGTPEDCCGCLRENGCTSVSESSCEDALNDGKSPPLSSIKCVEDNCYWPCKDYF